MNDLFEKLSSLTPIYCEHQKSTLFTEPLNLVTSVSFLAVAFLIYQLVKRHGKQGWIYKALPLLILFTGIGSTLWHAFRHPYSLLVDAIPIYVTTQLLLFMILQKLTSKIALSALLTGLFTLTIILLSATVPSDFLNGSIRHVTAIVTLALLVTWSYKRFGNLTHQLTATTLFYAFAITLRSMDLRLCSAISVGTHFLWHLLASISLYLIIKFLIETE